MDSFKPLLSIGGEQTEDGVAVVYMELNKCDVDTGLGVSV